jgi:hypothetical protein
MTHAEFIRSLTAAVRESGAAVALDEVRASRPRFDRGNYHDTRAVFFVWAVDRLVEAGLSDLGILWHPLVDDRSPLVWWQVGTLESVEAAERFVASTEALPGEPQPAEPTRELADSGLAA